jgi:hypothetical protein
MVTPVDGNKIAALRQTFERKGMGRILVVKPGQATFKGTESLKRLPNLYEKLAGFISQKFNIQVVDILSDVDGLLPILAADPSFMERIMNSNGDLEVLGHKMVIETADGESGKIYFLKDPENIRTASAARKTSSRQKPEVGTAVIFHDGKQGKIFPDVLEVPRTKSRSTPPIQKAKTKRKAAKNTIVRHNDLWSAIKGIANFSVLLNLRFQAGPHRIKITKLGGDLKAPLEFVFEIEGILKQEGGRDLPLTCVIKPNSVELEIRYPHWDGGGFTIYPAGRYSLENTAISFKQDIDIHEFAVHPDVKVSFQVSDLNLQAIAQVLLSSIKASQIDNSYSEITKMFNLIFIFKEKAPDYKRSPVGQVKSLLKQLQTEIGKLPNNKAKTKCAALVSRVSDLLSQLKIVWQIEKDINDLTTKLKKLAGQIKDFK